MVAILEQEFEILRTEDPDRCFWGRLARESKIYLAARSAIRKRRESGADEDDINSMTMDLYRKRYGKKGKDGELAFAPPLNGTCSSSAKMKQYFYPNRRSSLTDLRIAGCRDQVSAVPCIPLRW